MTKKLFTAIVMMVLTLSALLVSADEHGSALTRAKKESKPLLLYFYSDYCIYCEAMDRDVLLDKEIKKSLDADTVYLRVNVDKQTAIARRYNVRGYPTTWLVEPTGKRIAGVPGYIPKKDFKKILTFLKGKHYKTKTLSEFFGQ